MSDIASQTDTPHPGSDQMPRWESGDLPDAPVFTRRQWTMLLGPGLIMGGAAIGGGEWLTGPIVTARYGGAMLWLATLSILGQVIYNIEISRYTLYTGEPIFTGKFRTPPGPRFWIIAYILLDFGSFFPYLASSAATPLFTALNRRLPGPEDELTLRMFAYAIFLGAMIPLIFGGKIYKSLTYVMGFKIVAVLGFLSFLAVFYSTPATWWEIGSGFVEFGNVPVTLPEDSNGNGQLDEGEDWDSDGRLDVIEPAIDVVFNDPDEGQTGNGTVTVTIAGGPEQHVFPRDEIPDVFTTRPFDVDGDGQPDRSAEVRKNADGSLPAFIDLDGDGIRDGDNIDNVITAAITGRKLPPIDWSLIAFLSALVAISGSGGLSNTPVSNYTRDQGWGMGHHVGSIPSMVGGHDLSLSHVGTVFEPTEESMPRWRRWYKHIMRDQLAVWMPACFIGLALPSMLSVQFLARGTQAKSWEASVMTAGAIENQVGGSLGGTFWFLTLLCGFLVLAPSMAVSADGVIRRWVDAFWTASPRLRKLEAGSIRQVYFGVLMVYVFFGMIMLSLQQPLTLLIIATTIYNFALGLSCLHVVWLNRLLLPTPLRPGWFMTLTLTAAGIFFLFIAVVSTLQRFSLL